MSDEKRRRIHRQIIRKLRETYPDIYIVPGLGWCGPGWEEASRLETLRLREAGIA